MHRRKYSWVLAVAMLALIFIRPQEAVDGAQRAMRMWYTGVAPAMLPFLALMPMLTAPEACEAYRNIFSGIMNRLFHLPGAAAPAVIAAMISGSPGGAAIIYEMKANGGLSNSDAARIALAVSGVSPAWLVLGVGSAMLDSKAAGLKLAAIQAAVQLFLLKSLEKVKIDKGWENRDLLPAVRKKPLWSAVETVLGVCGYMAVFGAYGNVLASFIGQTAGSVLLTALDLPTGAALITQKAFSWQMAALGAALGFGGLCIAAQNMEKIRCFGICWRDYISVRIIAGVMCGVISVAVFGNQPLTLSFNAAQGKIYVISLFIAGICAVPGMIFLSKNIFLNKRKVRESRADSGQNPNR